MLGELVFREGHVGVASAEAVADAVAHERHRPVDGASVFDGLLLAGSAADADGMCGRESQPTPLPVVRDDGEVGESGRGEQRPDVETEPVGDHAERQALRRRPCGERRERRIEGTVLQRERDELLIAPAERGGLRDEDVAEADLARVERPVDLGERSGA